MTFTTNTVIRALARRIQGLNTEMRSIDQMLVALVGATAPSLLALYGAGPDTAASLLVAAGDNPERLNSEGSWAHLCGTSNGQAQYIPEAAGRYEEREPYDRQAVPVCNSVR